MIQGHKYSQCVEKNIQALAPPAHESMSEAAAAAAAAAEPPSSPENTKKSEKSLPLIGSCVRVCVGGGACQCAPGATCV